MLDEIDSLVSILDATWSGEGAAAHAEAHRRWAVGEATMRKALAQLQTAERGRSATTPSRWPRFWPCGR